MTHKTSVRIALFGCLPSPKNFAPTVPVGGAGFYSFNLDANGTVNVPLKAMSCLRMRDGDRVGDRLRACSTGRTRSCEGGRCSIKVVTGCRCHATVLHGVSQ